MTHVVHTFNVNRDLQGTVEDLSDKVARNLIRTGRARLATDDEVETGRAAEPELAEDQAPLRPAAAPTPAPAAEPEQPAAPATDTGPAPSGKVAAVPKPKATQSTAPTTPASTPTAGDAPAK